MAYHVVWNERTVGDLKALDRSIAVRVIDKVKNHLAGNPEKPGKPLKGVLRGLYRYRWDDYRIIYSIDKTEHCLAILPLGHRKDVYR